MRLGAGRRAVAGVALATLVLAPQAGAAEESEAVKEVRAVLRPHHGHTYKTPGYTSIEIITIPEAAYETATDNGIHTKLKWLTEPGEAQIIEQPWNCHARNEQFDYVITARAAVGETVSTMVRFRPQLSAGWCARAKSREAAAKRRQAAEARRQKERERISADTERERIESERKRFEAECEAHGGSTIIPGTFSSQREAEENEVLCRNERGETLGRGGPFD